MSPTLTLVLVAVINGVFALVVAGLTLWIGQSTKAIQHSVNSDRDAMIVKSDALVQKVADLELSIKKLLVERAAGESISPAMVEKLQSDKPLSSQ